MKHLAIFFICAASLSAQGLSGLFGGGSNAKRIQGVSVKSSLGCTDGQVLTYVAAETQFECTDVSVEGGSGDITGVTAGTGLTGGGTSGGVTLAIDSSVVTGAASLTTAGAIPYVASSGTLAQDTAIVRVSAGILGSTTYRSGDGSSTTPAFSFTSETNTGVYRVSARNLGLAVNGSPILGMGDNGGNYLRVVNGAIQYTTNIGAGGDVATTRSSANNLAVTNGSSTTYWTLGAGGILAGADNTYDIGASGANRPRDVNAARDISAGSSGAIGWSSRSVLISPSNGNIRMTNASATDFSLLQFGGTTSSFPALKRSSTTLAVRLADDSADAPISASNVTASGDFIGSSTSCIYLGATGTDGSWRWCRSGNNAVMERRESGSWVSKQVVTP